MKAPFSISSNAKSFTVMPHTKMQTFLLNVFENVN